MSQFKTDLTGYTLWYDGVVEIDPSDLEGLFIKGLDPKKIAVTEVTPDIIRYNRLASDKITTKDEIDADLISFDWNIPPEFLSIDIAAHVAKVATTKLAKYAGDDLRLRQERIKRELAEYTKRDLLNVLRVLIYTIDMFKKNKVVWGVGRGSSCASYILFLLEVHSVDPIKYDIPLEEFFKA